MVKWEVGKEAGTEACIELACTPVLVPLVVCDATPLTGWRRPGESPGISALTTSGPPLDHRAQRSRLLAPGGASNETVVVISGAGESPARAAQRDPIVGGRGADTTAGV